MADQHDAAPVVVIGQVVAPCGKHVAVCELAAPSRPAVWRYTGPKTRQTCEKRAACGITAAFSAVWIFRSAFPRFSCLTVG
ncbi:MAG TPA: hypothetical protein VMV08_11570 [Gaiellaceae bacterium]|nr:hypothetical protein [Gaiellaceae bacterium]